MPYLGPNMMCDVKVCTSCKIEKPCSDFYLRKDTTSGLSSHCRMCISAKNKDRSDEKRAYDNAYRAANIERIKAAGRAYHAANRDSRIAGNRQYKKENAERTQRQNQDWKNSKSKTDPVYAMRYRVKNAIKRAFRDKGYSRDSKAAQILGCSYSEFVVHLENHFLDGMTWENRSMWHIDHVTPLASASSPEDLTALNHYTNLRPLWALDNIRKGASMPNHIGESI